MYTSKITYSRSFVQYLNSNTCSKIPTGIIYLAYILYLFIILMFWDMKIQYIVIKVYLHYCGHKILCAVTVYRGSITFIKDSLILKIILHVIYNMHKSILLLWYWFMIFKKLYKNNKISINFYKGKKIWNLLKEKSYLLSIIYLSLNWLLKQCYH